VLAESQPAIKRCTMALQKLGVFADSYEGSSGRSSRIAQTLGLIILAHQGLAAKIMEANVTTRTLLLENTQGIGRLRTRIHNPADQKSGTRVHSSWPETGEGHVALKRSGCCRARLRFRRAGPWNWCFVLRFVASPRRMYWRDGNSRNKKIRWVQNSEMLGGVHFCEKVLREKAKQCRKRLR
jgi:hypothetical protein